MAKCNTNGRGKMKTKYETHEAAQKVITFIWSRDPNVNMEDLHTYDCPKCKKVHIGHDKYKRRILK